MLFGRRKVMPRAQLAGRAAGLRKRAQQWRAGQGGSSGPRLLRQVVPAGAREQPRAAWLTGGVIGGIAGIALGALAVASRFGREVVPLQRSLEAEPQVYQWRGRRIVYYQSGDEQAEPVVLLHSINAAASAYEMREPFARLADRYQVYALDLLGFGASDRPDIEYSIELYAELLADFLHEVSASAHVVASSLSAVAAVMAADRRPELFKSLLLINPTGMVALARQPASSAKIFNLLYRTPVVGAGLFNLLVSRPALRFYTRRLYSHPDLVRPLMIEQLYLTAHQPGARYAPAAFLSGMLTRNDAAALARLQPRTLVLWSARHGLQRIDRERQAYERAAPQLQMETFASGGWLPHDERGEEFAALGRAWLAREALPSSMETGRQ